MASDAAGFDNKHHSCFDFIGPAHSNRQSCTVHGRLEVVVARVTIPGRCHKYLLNTINNTVSGLQICYITNILNYYLRYYCLVKPSVAYLTTKHSTIWRSAKIKIGRVINIRIFHIHTVYICFNINKQSQK